MHDPSLEGAPNVGGGCVRTKRPVAKVVEHQIVGTHEADVNSGRLSVTAPLARALIGKSLGDSIEVISPGGSKFYEIIKVVYK